MSFGLGSALGIVAGARPGSAADRALSIGSLALYAVPSFWLGLVLSVVFAVQLRWFPTAGIETIASGKHGLARALDIARHLVLPVAALGFVYLALFLRMMRAGMAEAWRQDFALAARAKGLSRDGASCCATSRATRCCRSSPCSACRPPPCSAAASSSKASLPFPASAGWRRRRSPAATRRC